MFEQVNEAIQRQDYQTASFLLTELKQLDPDNPLVQFYSGRLYEATGETEAASQIYRQLLRSATDPRILSNARQGIERLKQIEEQEKLEELASIKEQVGSELPGVLVLEPIETEKKKDLASDFARIMQLDRYTAFTQLPSRAWRLYRTGNMGDLKYYTNKLQQASIPCFSTPINQINQINVYQVKYFESIAPEGVVCCENIERVERSLNFEWSEVKARVQGLMPIFEQRLEKDLKKKPLIKTKTLDYAQMCDLHLPQRNLILRLCDSNYEFNRGVSFSPKAESVLNIGHTAKENWSKLNYFLAQRLPEVRLWEDFTAFAETALDFSMMLSHIAPHIKLLRKEESSWDAAFQLYSGLVFLNYSL